MTAWLLSTPTETVALVIASGRKKALHAYQFEAGGFVQSSSRTPILVGSRAGGTVRAEEARLVDGEYVEAREVVT